MTAQQKDYAQLQRRAAAEKRILTAIAAILEDSSDAHIPVSAKSDLNRLYTFIEGRRNRAADS